MGRLIPACDRITQIDVVEYVERFDDVPYRWMARLPGWQMSLILHSGHASSPGRRATIHHSLLGTAFIVSRGERSRRFLAAAHSQLLSYLHLEGAALFTGYRVY